MTDSNSHELIDKNLDKQEINTGCRLDSLNGQHEKEIVTNMLSVWNLCELMISKERLLKLESFKIPAKHFTGTMLSCECKI